MCTHTCPFSQTRAKGCKRTNTTGINFSLCRVELSSLLQGVDDRTKLGKHARYYLVSAWEDLHEERPSRSSRSVTTDSHIRS